MQIGDYVLVTGNGAIEFIPPEGRDKDQISAEYEYGSIVGTVADVREPTEDTVVALTPPEPNIAPIFVTVGILSEKYAEGHVPG